MNDLKVDFETIGEKTDCFSFAILHYNFRITKKGFFNAQDLMKSIYKRYKLIAQEGKLCTAKKRREIRSTVYYANDVAKKKAILPNNPNKFRYSPS